MANILLQTTIVDIPDDWNVGRFSLLAAELRRAGHDVTARNRDEATDDSVLSVLDTLDYDQLWLMAVDTGDGLSPGDAAGIMRFRERGGGVPVPQVAVLSEPMMSTPMPHTSAWIVGDTSASVGLLVPPVVAAPPVVCWPVAQVAVLWEPMMSTPLPHASAWTVGLTSASVPESAGEDALCEPEQLALDSLPITPTPFPQAWAWTVGSTVTRGPSSGGVGTGGAGTAAVPGVGTGSGAGTGGGSVAADAAELPPMRQPATMLTETSASAMRWRRRRRVSTSSWVLGREPFVMALAPLPSGCRHFGEPAALSRCRQRPIPDVRYGVDRNFSTLCGRASTLSACHRTK